VINQNDAAGWCSDIGSLVGYDGLLAVDSEEAGELTMELTCMACPYSMATGRFFGGRTPLKPAEAGDNVLSSG
jgi:hypothetical protein